MQFLSFALGKPAHGLREPQCPEILSSLRAREPDAALLEHDRGQIYHFQMRKARGWLSSCR